MIILWTGWGRQWARTGPRLQRKSGWGSCPQIALAAALCLLRLHRPLCRWQSPLPGHSDPRWGQLPDKGNSWTQRWALDRSLNGNVSMRLMLHAQAGHFLYDCAQLLTDNLTNVNPTHALFQVNHDPRKIWWVFPSFNACSRSGMWCDRYGFTINHF